MKKLILAEEDAREEGEEPVEGLPPKSPSLLVGPPDKQAERRSEHDEVSQGEPAELVELPEDGITDSFSDVPQHEIQEAFKVFGVYVRDTKPVKRRW